MSTQGTPLSTFFSSFAFNRYTYDPTRDPADEFERLCIARLWGSVKREKYLAEYLSAVEETRDQQVAAFFRKYEFLQFTYSPSADPEAEFDRLRVARKWGEKKLKGIREEFQVALGGKVEATEWDESVTCDGSVILETHPNPATGYPTVSAQGTPLSAFFSSFNFNRYTYDPAQSPADEFERLCIARQWGKEKRDRYFAEYTSAIEKIHNQSVAIFFRKYEFLQFTYSPLADPVAEFERLQAARRWGGKNLERVRKEFQAALEGNVEAVEPIGEVIRETSPDPTAGHPTMPTQESPLSAFFSSFTFNHYTYDPTQDPADEFERLCVARKWGKAKKDKYFVNYLLAIEESRYQPLAVFFQKYQFLRFSHDPLADPRAEFARLQAARKWGEKKLSTVRVEFLAALGAGSSAAQPTTRPILERPPIAEFLKERQFSGYTYGSDRPELEFKKLVEAQRRHWEKEQEANGINVRSKESRRRWKADAERTRLQDEFYEALEQQFNARLDKIAGGTGLRRDEVMVELCGAGKAPLSKKEAIEVGLRFISPY